MAYSTKGTEEKIIETNYLKPGIHNTTIKSIKGTESEGGAPYIEVTLFKEGVNPDLSTDVRFYMSEKGIAKSVEKLNHMATRVVTKNIVDAIEGNTLEEYGQKLNAALAGKSFRCKFVGEEYVNSSGQVKVKTTIGLPPFAEAITEGAQYPVVPLESSKLKFDPNNQYDMKRLPTSTAPTGNESTGSLNW